ncbi:hypothetical protein GCK72_021684 [Caenorhabditis remanei]|uniref:DUF7154 domain-containing protein n=1 Tax=Caenorhabditis remanei TaxID=31234 RepID=A0A6A5GKR1_CAERE|nr:hypothetical protein GCK72_021684 [Caenorhabditis remanei]KAF1755115.1 hypothetical protein GCK72_021684 [Caenorhabditis remanei]
MKEKRTTVEIIDTDPPSEFEQVDKQRHFGILHYTVTDRFRKLMFIALVNLVILTGVFLFLFFLITRLDKKHEDIPISSTPHTYLDITTTSAPTTSTPTTSTLTTSALTTSTPTTFTSTTSISTTSTLTIPTPTTSTPSTHTPSTSTRTTSTPTTFKPITKTTTAPFSTTSRPFEKILSSHGKAPPTEIAYVMQYRTKSGIYDALLNGLPKSAESIKDPSESNDVLFFIDAFFESEVTYYGATLFIITKRLPTDNDISDLVFKLQTYHAYVTLVVSENSLGGSSPEPLYRLASETNGLCIFTEDDNIQQVWIILLVSKYWVLHQTPTWLPSIWPTYLVYSFNAEVANSGSTTLPIFNSPLVGYYYICMTLQDHGILDKFRMIHLDWSNNESSNSGSFKETLESHTAIYGNTTYVRKGPFKLDDVLYNMTLGFEYSYGKTNILQIRIYSVSVTNSLLLNNLPDPSELIKDPSEGSGVLDIIDLFFDSDVAHCGATLFILTKLYPRDTSIDDLVFKLQKYHAYVTFIVSENSFGGSQPRYRLASETNGLCIFTEDDKIQEIPFWLPSIWPSYLVYSFNAKVSSFGSLMLPNFNAPLVGDYHICMTLQDHEALDTFRMIHLDIWSSQQDRDHSKKLQNHMLLYIKGPFTLDAVYYYLRLGFEYSDEETHILQIRIYSASAVDFWVQRLICDQGTLNNDPVSSAPGIIEEPTYVEIIDTNPPPEFGPVDKQRHFGILRNTVTNRFRKLMLIALVNLVVVLFIFVFFLVAHLDKKHALTTRTDTTPYTQSFPTTTNPFDRTDCSPTQNSTFFFAYSNDLTAFQVLNTWNTIPIYVKLGYETIFFFNLDVTHCGASLLVLVKRLPTDSFISDLVSMLQKYHAYVTFIVSENSLGGLSSEPLYKLASETNGFCIFTEDDRIQQTPDWLPSIQYLYFLVYSFNAVVAKSGSVALPVFNAPEIEYACVCMTLQDHGVLDSFRMIHLDWNNNESSNSGSFEETLESHTAIYGNTTYITKSIFGLDAVPYNMTLGFEYLDDEINILQIRIYSASPVGFWVPYNN